MVALLHLDRWLASFTKIARNYRCSQTSNQGSHFSYSKEFSPQIPSGSWKATKDKMKGKNNLQESVLFSCNIEFKIDVISGFA